jgi:hypothetical protein
MASKLTSASRKSRVILCALITGIVVSACGGGHSPNLAAATVIQDGLRSPSSYSEISSATVWTGKDKDGEEAYIVKVTYDAQNGFGAMIRDCQYVAFNYDKDDKVRWYRNRSNDSCSDASNGGEEEVIHVLKMLNDFI